MNLPAEDRRIFGQLIKILNQMKITEVSGRLAVAIGEFFLGRPYKAGLLETKGTERVVINLQEFDCVTFVETVVALTWCVKSGQRSFEGFRRLLRKIRYRKGRLKGYPSRLHYFSDWIHDNCQKGLIRDVTPEIGGRPWKKTLHFMTTHPDLYPPLREAASLRRMKAIEREISGRSKSFIPKKVLRPLEPRIQEGDLVAITTNAEGLDIQHVGFAARVNNRVHLLNASSAEGTVVLSGQPLHHYLMQGETRSGIMVARIASEGQPRRKAR